MEGVLLGLDFQEKHTVIWDWWRHKLAYMTHSDHARGDKVCTLSEDVEIPAKILVYQKVRLEGGDVVRNCALRQGDMNINSGIW